SHDKREASGVRRQAKPGGLSCASPPALRLPPYEDLPSMRRLTRFYGPLVELSRLQSELNRLFSLFVESNKSVTSGSSWDPNVDILDDGENVRVLIELPGIEAEDVTLTIRGRVLTARGSKRGRIRSREGIRFFCM